VTAPTPEQRAAGERCVRHALEVELLTSRGDVDGAMEYLARVEHAEGAQMVTNITHLMALRLKLLIPEML
jgi:hypothetical protein